MRFEYQVVDAMSTLYIVHCKLKSYELTEFIHTKITSVLAHMRLLSYPRLFPKESVTLIKFLRH